MGRGVFKIDTKLKELIERCKLSSPNVCCESCGCNERQCLDALMDAFTEIRLEREKSY